MYMRSHHIIIGVAYGRLANMKLSVKIVWKLRLGLTRAHSQITTRNRNPQTFHCFFTTVLLAHCFFRIQTGIDLKDAVDAVADFECPFWWVSNQRVQRLCCSAPPLPHPHQQHQQVSPWLANMSFLTQKTSPKQNSLRPLVCFLFYGELIASLYFLECKLQLMTWNDSHPTTTGQIHSFPSRWAINNASPIPVPCKRNISDSTRAQLRPIVWVLGMFHFVHFLLQPQLTIIWDLSYY